jgi:hypothetical protein
MWRPCITAFDMTHQAQDLCMYVCICMYVCMCVYIYVYIYIYIYIYKYITTCAIPRMQFTTWNQSFVTIFRTLRRQYFIETQKLPFFLNGSNFFIIETTCFMDFFCKADMQFLSGGLKLLHEPRPHDTMTWSCSLRLVLLGTSAMNVVTQP